MTATGKLDEFWSLLGVRNSLGNDTDSQKLLNCCAETLKKKVQPEAERSHRAFQCKLLTLQVFIIDCKQECAKHSANGTAPSPALMQLPPCCTGAGAAIGLGRAPQHPTAPGRLAWTGMSSFLAVSCCLLMIKHILGIPLSKAVVKVAELTGLLQRNR